MVCKESGQGTPWEELHQRMWVLLLHAHLGAPVHMQALPGTLRNLWTWCCCQNGLGGFLARGWDALWRANLNLGSAFATLSATISDHSVCHAPDELRNHWRERHCPLRHCRWRRYRWLQYGINSSFPELLASHVSSFQCTCLLQDYKKKS